LINFGLFSKKTSKAARQWLSAPHKCRWHLANGFPLLTNADGIVPMAFRSSQMPMASCQWLSAPHKCRWLLANGFPLLTNADGMPFSGFFPDKPRFFSIFSLF
jgi:hypothetical protein